MKRKVHYFKHESNARNDEKLLAVRRDYGMEGYGVYWSIVEMLREADEYSLPTDYHYIAWELHVAEELIKHIVEDYDLFIVEDGCFYSERLCCDMKKEREISEKRSEFGKKGMQSRWGNGANQTTQAIQTELPLPTPPTDPQTPPQTPKTRSKKYSPEETQLHSQCKEYFDAVYSHYKGNSFYWKAKEMSAIVGILKQIRFYMPEEDKENLGLLQVNFQTFVRMIFERADDWVKANVTPSLINSKFNEIYTQLKNNTKNGNRHNTSGGTEHVNARDDDEYLASLVAELRASQNQ